MKELITLTHEGLVAKVVDLPHNYKQEMLGLCMVAIDGRGTFPLAESRLRQLRFPKEETMVVGFDIFAHYSNGLIEHIHRHSTNYYGYKDYSNNQLVFEGQTPIDEIITGFAKPMGVRKFMQPTNILDLFFNQDYVGVRYKKKGIRSTKSFACGWHHDNGCDEPMLLGAVDLKKIRGSSYCKVPLFGDRLLTNKEIQSFVDDSQFSLQDGFFSYYVQKKEKKIKYSKNIKFLESAGKNYSWHNRKTAFEKTILD